MIKKKKVDSSPLGIIRIQVKDSLAYEKTAAGWKKSSLNFPHAQKVILAYKQHHNLKLLVDENNPSFVKGQLGWRKQIQGPRINILPDGERLDKAFSLFAKNLTLHDQSSDDHWDLMYQNKGGTYSYCYAVEKIKQHRDQKYKKVDEFASVYEKLLKRVGSALRNKEDIFALPMYTLLKTHMRVGNEIYYNTHGHKGLTTLKKNDISVHGDIVKFDYIAKDGVPVMIERKFPPIYVERLKRRLEELRPNNFVFSNPETGNPLRDHHFKAAFLNYCGHEFYPHIIRSYYATSKVKEFLKGKRRIDREEVKSLYLSIAEELGHKKFVKKEHRWKNNPTVTVNHYIQPELVDKVRLMMR